VEKEAVSILQERTAGSKALLLLLAVVVVSRLPFLWAGYGADADAWMVARAADRLWHTGIYEPSRLPGYPLHEIIMAPMVVSGGAPPANGFTLVASLLALIIWYRLAARTSRFPLLSTAGLAFMPLFWIPSDTTIDYVWSLLFILLSLTGLRNRRISVAGICLGLAVGFRPANAVATLPLLTLLLLQEKSPVKATRFVLWAVAISAVAFTPLIMRYGMLGWMRETHSEMSDIRFTVTERLQFFTYRSLYSVGPLAALVVATLLLLRRNLLHTLLRSGDALFAASLVGVGTYILLFFGYPLDRSYLLPGVPFLLIVIDRLAARNQYILFTCCLISFALVNPDLVVHKGIVGTPGFNVHWGPVVEDYEKRNDLLEDRSRIACLQLPEKAMVMTGGAETFWFQNEKVERDTSGPGTLVRGVVFRQKQNPDLYFVAMLSRNEILAARSSGFIVYCLAGAQQYIEKVTGLRMTDEGIPIVYPGGCP
jgi:hypothetical protein